MESKIPSGTECTAIRTAIHNGLACDLFPMTRRASRTLPYSQEYLKPFALAAEFSRPGGYSNHRDLKRRTKHFGWLQANHAFRATGFSCAGRAGGEARGLK